MKDKILHLFSFVVYFAVVGVFFANELIELGIIISRYIPILLLSIAFLFLKKHILVDIILFSGVLSGSVGCMLDSLNKTSLIPIINLVEIIVLVAGFIVAIVFQILYDKKFSDS